MYSVLKSIRDTHSVISQTDTAYIDMIRSGNYEEVHTGTRKECEDWVETNTQTENQ